MEKREIAEVLSYVKVAYPNSFRNMSEADKKAILNLWYRQFKDYPFEIVINAIDGIISCDNSAFMPSIGRIKEMIGKLTSKPQMSEQEAWNLVYKALENSGYHAEEEFKALPPIVQKIVGSPSVLKEWCMMPIDQVNSVVASNFQRSYRARAKHEEEVQALPNSVKMALGNKQFKEIGNGE